MDLKSTSNDSILDSLKESIIDSNIPASKEEEIIQIKPEVKEKNKDLTEPGKNFSMEDIEIDEQVAEIDSVDQDKGMIDNLDAPKEMVESVDFGKINIENDKKGAEEPVFSFDDSREEKKEKKWTERVNGYMVDSLSGRSLTVHIVGVIVSIILILITVGFYFSERYTYYATQPEGSLTENELSALKKINEYRKMGTSVGLIDTSELVVKQNITNKTALEVRKNLTNKDIRYIHKYEYGKGNINMLNKKIPQEAEKLRIITEELSSYPFFPRDIQQVISIEDEYSLQRSLLSLEGVKLRAALAVFSKFDSFVGDFALEVGKSREEVKVFIEKVLDRGEKDIDIYLKTCYMNPYEKPNTCAQYGDFARTYDMRARTGSKEEKIDADLFARMMGFIDTKLESSILPSLSMSASNFDPKKQTLTLDLAINTLPEDALQLLNKGILNPHIYIVSNMINFLRQSKFIISKDIKINELEIDTVMVPIGSKEIPVAVSQFSFDLPLQKATEREITDFYYGSSQINVLEEEVKEEVKEEIGAITKKK